MDWSENSLLYLCTVQPVYISRTSHYSMGPTLPGHSALPMLTSCDITWWPLLNLTSLKDACQWITVITGQACPKGSHSLINIPCLNPHNSLLPTLQ